MGANYTILGRSIPPHFLAIGTILTVVGGITIPKAFSSPVAAKASTTGAAPTEKPQQDEFDVVKAIEYVFLNTIKLESILLTSSTALLSTLTRIPNEKIDWFKTSALYLIRTIQVTITFLNRLCSQTLVYRIRVVRAPNAFLTMTLILAIGDLHIPERAVEIPPKFRRLLSAPGKISQVLCHGNVTRSPETLNFLKSISSDFQLVKGQLDWGKSSLPTSLVFTHDQLKVGLINGSCVIPNSDPLSLLTQARMMDVDILLFGGTHKLEAYTLDGKFFISPGSASGAFTTNLPDREDFEAINYILKTEYQKDTSELKKEGEKEEETSLSENLKDSSPKVNQEIEELLHPIPSFCLLDVKGASCTLYLYTYVDGDVKVDKVSYRKQDT